MCTCKHGRISRANHSGDSKRQWHHDNRRAAAGGLREVVGTRIKEKMDVWHKLMRGIKKKKRKLVSQVSCEQGLWSFNTAGVVTYSSLSFFCLYVSFIFSLQFYHSLPERGLQFRAAATLVSCYGVFWLYTVGVNYCKGKGVLSGLTFSFLNKMGYITDISNHVDGRIIQGQFNAN